MTSHAAVVARHGETTVCGAGAVNRCKLGTMSVAGRSWKAGDVITIDGGSGDVFDGRCRRCRPSSPAISPR
jgi:pyruvate,orthophosphate dikinase